MAMLDVDGCPEMSPPFRVLDEGDDADNCAIALWDVNREKPVRVTLDSGATAITAKDLSAMGSNGHCFAISMAHEPVLPLVLDIDCTQCHTITDANASKKCVRAVDRISIIGRVVVSLKRMLPADVVPQLEDYFSVQSYECSHSMHLFFPRLFLSTLSYIFVVSNLGLTQLQNCRFDIPSHLPLPYTRVARKPRWHKFTPMPARPEVLDLPIWPPPVGVTFLDHQILASAENAIPNYQLVCTLYNGRVPLQNSHVPVESELAFTDSDILGLQIATEAPAEEETSVPTHEVNVDNDVGSAVAERKLYHARAFTTRLWCGLPAYKEELGKNIELSSWRAKAQNTIYTHFVALFNSALTSCEIIVQNHMEGGESDATQGNPAPRSSSFDEAAYLAMYKFVRYVDTATPRLEELDVAMKWRAFFTEYNKGYFWHVICCLLEHTFSSTQAHVSLAEDRTTVWAEYVASFQNMLLWAFGKQDLELQQSIMALSKLANAAIITGAYATSPLKVIYTIVNLTRDPCAPTRLSEVRALFATAADIVQLDSIMTKLVRSTLHMVELDGLANKEVLVRRLFYNHDTGLYVPFESSHLATIKAVYMERAAAISDEKSQAQNFKVKLTNLVLSGIAYTRCVFDFNPMYIATEKGLFCTINGLYTNSVPPVVCKNTPIPAVVNPLVYKIPTNADQRSLNIAAIKETQFGCTFFGVVVSEITSLFLLTVYIPGIKQLLQVPTLNNNSAGSIVKAIDVVMPFKKLGKKKSVHLTNFFFLSELESYLQGLQYRDLLYVMWVLSKHDSYNYETFVNNAEAHLGTHYTNKNLTFLVDSELEQRPLVDMIRDFTDACRMSAGDTRISSSVRGEWAPHILASNLQGIHVYNFTTAWFTAITFLCLSIASNNNKLGGYLAAKLKSYNPPEIGAVRAPQAKRRRLMTGGHGTSSFESLLDGEDEDVRPKKVPNASHTSNSHVSVTENEDLRFKEAFLRIAKLRRFPLPDDIALVGAGPYFVEMRTMCQRHHWNARNIAEFSMCISVSLQCTNPRKPIVVLQGSHRGGKSVYIRSLENAFKGSVVATIEQPLVNKADGSAQPQQVMAMESHLYIVKETDRASSGSLKSLSGADRSTSRDLYKGPGLRDTKPLVIIVSNEPVLEIRKADPATYDRFFMFTVYGMYCSTPDVPNNYLLQFEQRRYQQRNIDEATGSVVAMNLNYAAFLLAKKEGGNIITTSAAPEMKKRRNEQMCANMPEMNVLRLGNIMFTGRGKIKYDDMYRAVEGPLNDLFARRRQYGQPAFITMKPSANKGSNKHNIGTVHEFMVYMKQYSGNFDNGVFCGYEFVQNDSQASIMEPDDLRRQLCKKFEVVWKEGEQNSGTTNVVLMKRHIFGALDKAKAIWPVIFQDIQTGDDSFASAVLAHFAKKGEYDKVAQVFNKVVESVSYVQ